MPAPIDMTTPPSAYGANPGFMPVQTAANQPMGFTGNAPAMQQAAEAGIAPAQKRIDEDQKKVDENTKLAQFKQFIAGGLTNMQAYVNDVSKQNPELGKQAAMKLQALAPFYPGMKPDEAEKASVSFLDDINNQLHGFTTRKLVGEGKSLNEVIAASNLGEKETINALGQQANRDNQKDIAGIKADTAAQAQELKRWMTEQNNETKIRVANLKKGASGGFQLSYRDAISELAREDAWLKTFSEKTAGMNPMVVEMDYPGQLKQHMALRAAWIKAKDRALEKGAAPDDMVDVPDNTNDPNLSPAPGAPSAPSVPPTTLPKVTSKSSDQEIAKIAQVYKDKGSRKGRPVTPAEIATVRAALLKDEQGGR